MLGKITQKSLGLSGKEGLSFFSFPGVTSPNRFKQLYRSRMNSIELTEAATAAVLKEAVDAFQCNIEVRFKNSQPGVRCDTVRKRKRICRPRTNFVSLFPFRFLMTCRKC